MFSTDIILNILSFSDIQTINNFIFLFGYLKYVICAINLIELNEENLFLSCEKNYYNILNYFVEKDYKIQNKYFNMIINLDYLESFIVIKNLIESKSYEKIFELCFAYNKRKIFDCMIRNKMYPNQCSIDVSCLSLDIKSFENIIMNTNVKIITYSEYTLQKINDECNLDVFKKIVIEERIQRKKIFNYFSLISKITVFSKPLNITFCLFLFENYKEYIPDEHISIEILKIYLKEQNYNSLDIFISKIDFEKCFERIFREVIEIGNEMSRIFLNTLSQVKKRIKFSQITILYNEIIPKRDKEETIKIILNNFEIFYDFNRDGYEKLVEYSKHDRTTEYFLDNIPKENKFNCLVNFI